MSRFVDYKRCLRKNEPGHAHALTFTCFHVQPLLSKPRTCEWLAASINRAGRKHCFSVWAYVFMPNHVHLLICPTQREYCISRILESIKLPVTRRALAFVKNIAPEFLPRMRDRQPGGKAAYRFWQRGGGYDRNLTEPATIWAEMDYLHANPVRRELCIRPEDWLWSSAAHYAGARESAVVLDPASLPRTGNG